MLRGIDRRIAKPNAMRGTLIGLALAIAGGSAVAQTQIELDIWANESLRRSVDELDAIYGTLNASISVAGRHRLQATQRAWLRFRDQQCEFENAGTVGGSIHSMMIAECLKRLTNQRTQDLRRLVDCGSGDPSCSGL